MRKLRFASLLLLAWQGCTDAQNVSMQVTYTPSQSARETETTTTSILTSPSQDAAYPYYSNAATTLVTTTTLAP